MADKPPAQDDLSIEEILGSIRRIIAEDDDAPEKGAVQPVTADDEDDEEPLELTSKIEEDGSITDMSRPEADQGSDEPFLIEDSSPKPEEEPDVAPDRFAGMVAEPLPTPSKPPAQTLAKDSARMSKQEQEFVSPDNLLSSTTAEATSAVMAKLARHTAIADQGHAAQQGATIESMVRDMLRPMLREWLDGNLPQMVQTLVQREIEKLSKGL